MNTAVTSLPLAPAGDASASSGAGLRWFVRAGNGLWNALVALGRARDQHQLLEIADRCQALQPELARELRAATRQGPMA